jgi:outer membrane protein TolC
MKALSRLQYLRKHALAAALGLALAAAASPAGALTLDEARARALDQSPQLAAARAEARAARSQAGAASWSRLPHFQADLGASRTDHPVGVFSALLGQQEFTAADFGTFDPQTMSFDLSTLNTPDPRTNFRAAVSVRQPLWTGGAITGQLHAARAQAEAAEAMASRTREQVLFQTEQAFRLALLAEEQVALLRESLGLARGHAARVNRFYDEGLALQSSRQALTAFVREIEAKLAGAEADSVEGRSVLGLVLGEDGPITEPLIDPGDEHVGALTLADAMGTAEDRDDVRAARQAWKAAGAQVGMARSQVLPALEFMAGAEHNSEDFFGTGGDQWMVGLGARWSLDPGSPARIRAAGAMKTAAERRMNLAMENARHEARVAYSRAVAADQRKVALDAAVTAAGESYRLMVRRHEEGIATTLELTESQNTLTRTRLEAASARHDRALALASLRLAAGTQILSEESR